ncbi:MAG: AfsR/SARP family transcriptional regulator [Acidimicrobiales bacterium]
MRLITFGRPHIAHGENEEVALQPLPLAVLAYLAMAGPRDRSHLAELFWPSSKSGLNSLSTTLNRIRAQVPGGVWVRGNNVVGIEMASDVQDLRAAFDRADFESVVQLYRAPFLGSLKLRRQSSEFEDWVLDSRTTLASMVELTLLQRGRDLFDTGQHRAAAEATEAAWDIAIRDGFPSPDYFETYHRIMASAARPGANDVRTMAAEFGIALQPVEPVALEPVALEPDAFSAKPSEPGPIAADGPGIARASSQLFGCQEELDAIEASVDSKRLTTVVGLGGSGKTRLAAEFFNSSNVERDFPHRYWVNLRDVADHELVAPMVAASLDQSYDGTASLADRLPDDEPVLLVLDNFEHVLEAATIAAELIDGNEALRILVTSRVPLKLADESLVSLNGLDTLNLNGLDSPAAQLFVTSARRAGVDSHRLNDSSQAAISEVCRRVGGNPLALEIAGGWTQILSPTEILDALSLGNELLGSPMAGGLRSMDVVLNQSWSTLAETEQNTLMLLATFPAGCLTREVLQLPELSITSIGRLVQHSLVRQHIEGRITLHPLVAGHALSELEQRPELRQEFHRALSSWCQSFAKATQSSSNSTDWRIFDAEIPNFASAWSWDARHGLWELHRSTLGPLRRFFSESGRSSEGQALFAVAAEALRSDPNRDQDLLAAVLEALGWFHMLLGQLSEARVILDEALALSSDDNPQVRAQVLRSVGSLQLTVGEADEATANFEAGLALIADDPSELTAPLQHNLAQAHHYRGERELAAKAARMALRSGRTAGDSIVIVRSHLLLADIEVESDPQLSLVLLNEGWSLAKEASLDHLAIYFPLLLGLAHLNLDEPKLAESFFTEGMDAARSVGQLSNVCANYVGRAEARLLLERTDDAVEDLKTGIRLSLRVESGRYLLWAAVVSCRAAALQQAPGEQTKELLSLALCHPAADQDARDKAAMTWRDLFDDAPTPSMEPRADSEVAGLDEVTEMALGLLTIR